MHDKRIHLAECRCHLANAEMRLVLSDPANINHPDLVSILEHLVQGMRALAEACEESTLNHGENKE